MKVPFFAAKEQHQKILPELMEAVESVLSSGCYILGEEVEKFEEMFSQYHGAKHAIAVNSGTDALILTMKALGIGPGDEVITTGNTFVTSVSSIVLVGAKPVLVDVGSDDNVDANLIEQHLTSKTKAILPVHWTGRPCDMEAILNIADRHKLFVIEDCAQAIAARYAGKLVGTFSTAGCFSLHPYKTLNACGDGGIVITNNADLAEKICLLRHNGLSMDGVCHYWSSNSRLDPLQAKILQVKFKYLKAWTESRVRIAEYYYKNLCDVPEIELPQMSDPTFYSVYHTYIIKALDRDELKLYLDKKGIQTRINYETPIHKQPVACNFLQASIDGLPRLENIVTKVLSLPIYPELTKEQLDHVILVVKEFYRLRTFNENAIGAASKTTVV